MRPTRSQFDAYHAQGENLIFFVEDEEYDAVEVWHFAGGPYGSGTHDVILTHADMSQTHYPDSRSAVEAMHQRGVDAYYADISRTIQTRELDK